MIHFAGLHSNKITMKAPYMMKTDNGGRNHPSSDDEDMLVAGAFRANRAGDACETATTVFFLHLVKVAEDHKGRLYVARVDLCFLYI